MRFLIQRVSKASVVVNEKTIGRIKNGYVVFIGIGSSDTKDTADKLIKKMINLRIFEDADGKTNLSLKDVDGELLLISQFTLYANCKKGNRPSFIDSGAPRIAEELYKYIISECKEKTPVVEQGSFGSHMEVILINDGPFTVMLDSEYI